MRRASLLAERIQCLITDADKEAEKDASTWKHADEFRLQACSSVACCLDVLSHVINCILPAARSIMSIPLNEGDLLASKNRSGFLSNMQYKVGKLCLLDSMEGLVLCR
jgi:hypothetical protein